MRYRYLVALGVIFFSCSCNHEKKRKMEFNITDSISVKCEKLDSLGMSLYILDSTFVYLNRGSSVEKYILEESTVISDLKTDENIDRKFIDGKPIIGRSTRAILSNKIVFKSINEKLYKSFYFEEDSVIYLELDTEWD